MELREISTFLPLNSSAVVVFSYYKKDSGEFTHEHRAVSLRHAALLADIVWDLVVAGKVKLEPFIQVGAGAWGWNAKVV